MTLQARLHQLAQGLLQNFDLNFRHRKIVLDVTHIYNQPAPGQPEIHHVALCYISSFLVKEPEQPKGIPPYHYKEAPKVVEATLSKGKQWSLELQSVYDKPLTIAYNVKLLIEDTLILVRAKQLAIDGVVYPLSEEDDY